ncbi:hypothetical protein ES703_80882 [subsurface metagenome]
MTEHRSPTTTKVTAMIQAHADLLLQHGIAAGLHASRPATGTVNEFYFSTDLGIWAHGNGTGWDECQGLSEAYIQGLIDASITILKDYVDSMVQGLDWQPSVLDELATPPGSPAEGDRYLVIATATGDWAGHEKDITEWNGTSWDFTTPNKGFAVWIEDVGRQKNYNGTDWVAFGSTVDHGNLVNVTPDQHHTAPTYDPAEDEIVFQI